MQEGRRSGGKSKSEEIQEKNQKPAAWRSQMNRRGQRIKSSLVCMSFAYKKKQGAGRVLQRGGGG